MMVPIDDSKTFVQVLYTCSVFRQLMFNGILPETDVGLSPVCVD